MSHYRLTQAPRLVEPANRLSIQSRHSNRLLGIWVLGLIIRGEVPLCIGGQQGIVRAGQYYLMPANVRHYGTVEADFEVIYFHFLAESEPCEALDKGALPVFGTTPPHLNVAEWFDFLRGCDDFGSMDETSWNLHLSALLNQLHLAARGFDASGPNEKLLGAVFDYLREQAGRSLDQAHLSGSIGYSYDHLDRLFRARFGTTIYRRHSELRFEQAVALMQTGHSLKETARAIGFGDYYHFLKAFKRVRGCSPGQFLRTRRDSSTGNDG